MADSLRDQLLKSGIVKQVRDEKRASQPPAGKPAHKPFHKQGGKPGNSPAKQGGKPQQASARPPRDGEIDLAKAYAIRKQAESTERRQAEQAAAEEARLKRERKQKVQLLLQGQALNRKDAEHARHFEYGGKIRRVYVDQAQLAALNAGELGVVQQGGHYLVVSRAIAEQVREIDAHLLALLPEPGTDGVGEDGVPDDLVW
ncbi:DUF2058 family protein [Dyella sp. LX-66]|uniref:DUF2058 domain-containing protein n=1 Tax=unclassified Dyella TaxID=2634549 RepID=UPI001BE05578|nr:MULTISPECIES: DUF2058 family protein [unclassified Dyella]MBT2116878.1 DUF2058 family protein [Dyella sp. LX-1]MBT2138942.1 DUF2058 family protein [Dyella sp. LX-66]